VRADKSEGLTPGPWGFVEEGNLRDMGSIVGSNGETICWFGDSERYYPSEGEPPNDADLALILAAPDMLRSLRDAESWLSSECPPTIRDQIKATITKALEGVK